MFNKTFYAIIELFNISIYIIKILNSGNQF